MKKIAALVVALWSVGLSAADGANGAMVSVSAVRDVPPVVAPYRVQAAKNLAKNALWLAAAVATIKFTSKALADDEKARMIELHRKNLAEGYQDMLLEYEEKYKKELTRQELAQRYGMRVPNQQEMQKIVADDLAVLRSADEQVLGRADLLPEDEDQDSGESSGMGVTVPQAVVEPKMLAPWQRPLYQGLYAAAWGMVIFQSVGVLSNLKAWWHDKEQMPSVWHKLQAMQGALTATKSLATSEARRIIGPEEPIEFDAGVPEPVKSAALSMVRGWARQEMNKECRRQALAFCNRSGISSQSLFAFLDNRSGQATTCSAGKSAKWLFLPEFLIAKQAEVLAYNKVGRIQRVLRRFLGQPYWANVLTSWQKGPKIFDQDHEKVLAALSSQA